MSKLSEWFSRKPDEKAPAAPPPPRKPARPPPIPAAALRVEPRPSAPPRPPPLKRYNEEPMTELMDRFADGGVLGEGGMCLVHRILDRNLGRQVAMKVLRPEMIDNADFVRGFLAEARVTSQLDHPSIPPVYEMGVDPEGTRYFTMKLLEGQSLTQWAAERAAQPTRVVIQQLLPIIMKVCEAVAFAHDRGVVHRDIKPDNVMVGRFGEVHVVDWGVYQLVAKGASGGERGVDAGSVGHRGWTDAQMGGTLQYMAPEQAEGRTADIDGRTDIFAVGALVYYVLGGRGPYSELPVQEALRRAQRGQYHPLATLNPDTPPGLCRIVHQAMSPSPSDRYASALDLKEDLQAFMATGFQLPSITFPAGTRILREGEEGDTAYMIVSGTCVVLRHIEGFVQELTTLGPGAVFGELALLSRQPRNATVEAKTDVTALAVTRDHLEAEMKGSFLGRLLGVVVERYRKAEEETRSAPVAAFNLD